MPWQLISYNRRSSRLNMKRRPSVEHQRTSSGCPFRRTSVSTGTGLAMAPWVKQLSWATRTRRAILSLLLSDSTSTRTSMPRLPLWIVPLRMEPFRKKRVTWSTWTCFSSSFISSPDREICVSSQNASPALKYANGGGAVSSPPTRAPSSHWIAQRLPAGWPLTSLQTSARFFCRPMVWARTRRRISLSRLPGGPVGAAEAGAASATFLTISSIAIPPPDAILHPAELGEPRGPRQPGIVLSAPTLCLADGHHLVTDAERGVPRDRDRVLHALVGGTALRMDFERALGRLAGLQRHAEIVMDVDGFDPDSLADARDATVNSGGESLAVEGDLAPCQGATQGAVHSPRDGGNDVVERRRDRRPFLDAVVLPEASLDTVYDRFRHVSEIRVPVAA